MSFFFCFRDGDFPPASYRAMLRFSIDPPPFGKWCDTWCFFPLYFPQPICPHGRVRPPVDRLLFLLFFFLVFLTCVPFFSPVGVLPLWLEIQGNCSPLKCKPLVPFGRSGRIFLIFPPPQASLQRSTQLFVPSLHFRTNSIFHLEIPFKMLKIDTPNPPSFPVLGRFSAPPPFQKVVEVFTFLPAEVDPELFILSEQKLPVF